MDGAFETVRQPPATVQAAEARMLLAQMLENLPEELLGNARRPMLVGVAQVVARGRRCPPDGGERPGVQAQRVAHIVEAHRVGELRVDEGDNLAPVGIGARLGRVLGLGGKVADQTQWHEVADLPQCGELASSWLGCGCFHTSRVAAMTALANSLFDLLFATLMGWLWMKTALRGKVAICLLLLGCMLRAQATPPPQL